MPQYSYMCSGCEDLVTVVRSFSEEEIEDCPTCMGRLRRRFFAPAIKFNGSGFYSTEKETV
jgi:putative FmdB family regulatory protein